MEFWLAVLVIVLLVRWWMLRERLRDIERKINDVDSRSTGQEAVQQLTQRVYVLEKALEARPLTGAAQLAEEAPPQPAPEPVPQSAEPSKAPEPVTVTWEGLQPEPESPAMPEIPPATPEPAPAPAFQTVEAPESWSDRLRASAKRG